MKQSRNYYNSKEYAQEVLFGFKPIETARDVVDNIHRFLHAYYSPGDAGTILRSITIAYTKENEEFFGATGELEFEYFIQYCDRPSSFPYWKKKKSKWIKPAVAPDLTEVLLDILFKYAVIQFTEFEEDFLLSSWQDLVVPELEKEVKLYVTSKTDS